jgi:hypothetical protein
VYIILCWSDLRNISVDLQVARKLKKLITRTHNLLGSWAGFATRTTITVEKGKIVERHFKYTTVPTSTTIPPTALEWTENENEINNHPESPALTLDEVYDKARNEWLLKRKSAKTYFEAKNNGLISSCGYVEDGCQDDCFIGIYIDSIEKR